MARALYKKPRVLLIDGTLSSLDSRVAASILKEMRLDGLMADKLVVLVTYDLDQAERMDWVIHMGSGGEVAANMSAAEFFDTTDKEELKRQIQTNTNLIDEVEQNESADIIKNEEDEKISIGFGVLFELFSFCDTKYGGRYSIIAIVLAHIFINIMVSSLSLYLAHALSDPENMGSIVLPLVTIMLVTFAVTVGGKYLSSLIFMSINRNLHNAAIHALIKTDLAFFDTNTSGRIISRLSKDIGDIDAFVFTFLEMCDYWVKCSFSLVFIVISSPWLLIYLVFEMYYFYSLKQRILRITTHCRRLVAVTNSPIVSLIQDVMNGQVTIRALKC